MSLLNQFLIRALHGRTVAVLYYACYGQSNEWIANALVMSKKTVNYHLGILYEIFDIEGNGKVKRRNLRRKLMKDVDETIAHFKTEDVDQLFEEWVPIPIEYWIPFLEEKEVQFLRNIVKHYDEEVAKGESAIFWHDYEEYREVKRRQRKEKHSKPYSPPENQPPLDNATS